MTKPKDKKIYSSKRAGNHLGSVGNNNLVLAPLTFSTNMQWALTSYTPQRT